jgi:hypothetical protein
MSQGLNYYGNFDDSQFKEYENTDSTRLNSDECYINQRNNDNTKKLKYFTTNHVDLLKARENYNFFGIAVQEELFVPSSKIDTYSNLLNGNNGGVLTSCNVKSGFGQLPVQSSFRGQVSHGDVVTEDRLQKNLEVKKNACLPRDSESDFINRQYQIFTNIEVPNAVKSVETPSVGYELGRNGVPTRFCQRYN